MRKGLFLSSAAAAAMLFALAPTMATAQQEEQAAQPEEQQQVAQECLTELQTTAQQLAQEGYWITGWGQRWGWGVGQPGMVQPPEATGALPQEDLPEEGPPPGPAADPWGFGPMAGTASPRHQIRTLFSAAHVLAYQGDQEGCEYVLARLQQTAEGHLTDLREMGVQPEEVVDWRREAMAGAVPLTQLEPTGMFLDNLTGADVRNLQDEYLGSVSDIILDIDEGEPEYVVVARGGFLGIGEDHVLVPWENLSAAPELHVLILDMPEEQFAEAPAVDPDVAADAEWMQEYRRQTDDYWQQQREG